MSDNQKPVLQPCWICGSPATTGEHKTKRSDLAAMFSPPSQQAPLYFRAEGDRTRRIGSFDNKLLKYPDLLCAHCNNARTQPHDLAWERLSNELRDRVARMTKATQLRPNRVFPYSTRVEMLHVHLYFVKILGGIILEGDIPIDIHGFSRAILDSTAHPHVYLKFGRMRLLHGKPYVGRSNVDVANRVSDGRCAFATWFYSVGDVSVNVMFALPGEHREGLTGAWHPRLGVKMIQLADFA